MITLDHQLARRKQSVFLTKSSCKHVVQLMASHKKLLLYRSKPTKCEVQWFHVNEKQKQQSYFYPCAGMCIYIYIYITCIHISKNSIKQSDYENISMHLRFKVMSLHVKLMKQTPGRQNGHIYPPGENGIKRHTLKPQWLHPGNFTRSLASKKRPGYKRKA